MKACSPPENIGDIYAVHGYGGIPVPRYGVVYQAADSKRPGYWCWWLAMDDGDQYEWPHGEMPDMFADSLEVYRRNPVPDWTAGLEVKP